MDRLAIVVAMARIRRRLTAISGTVKTVPISYRSQLRQWVDDEWAATKNTESIEESTSQRDIVHGIDHLSQDRRLDSESMHVRLRAIAQWLAAVVRATNGTHQDDLKNISHRCVGLLREIRQTPSANGPDAWFHAEKKQA